MANAGSGASAVGLDLRTAPSVVFDLGVGSTFLSADPDAGNADAAAVIYYPHESTPEIVEAHLRADQSLTPETAAALSELFRVAYTQFSRSGNEKGARKRR